MGQERARGSRPQGRLAKWRRSSWFIPVLLVALALIFIFENTAEAQIRLIVPVVTMPLCTPGRAERHRQPAHGRPWGCHSLRGSSPTGRFQPPLCACCGWCCGDAVGEPGVFRRPGQQPQSPGSARRDRPRPQRASGQPGWLSSILTHAANLVAHRGMSASTALVVALTVIAVGVLKQVNA